MSGAEERDGEGAGGKPGDSDPLRRDAEAKADLRERRAADPHDAAELEDEVWFEADELERASQVRLGISAHALRAASAADHLAALGDARWLSLATLPGWPGAPATGSGWGELARQVGGVRPGWLGLVTADAGGAGRSALVLQLAEGLARLERGEGTGVVCPVAILGEDSEQELLARSLARWTGRDARIFFGGREAAAICGCASDEAVERALAEARRALAGPLAPLQHRQRFFHADGRALGDGLLDELCHELATWRHELAAAEGIAGERVWPVVVVDPLEAWSPPGSAAACLHELARLTRREGWITFATTREAAIRSGLHDAACDLRISVGGGESSEGAREWLDVRVDRCRLGPRGSVALPFDPVSGRWSAGTGGRGG